MKRKVEISAFLTWQRIAGVLNPIIAVVLAFTAAGLIVLLSGENPLEAYSALASGAFGSLTGIKNTIRYTLPILMLALSFVICSKAGYFNIGQEGQVNAAGLAIVTMQVLFPNMPDASLLTIMILAAMIAAVIVALVPAVLKFLLGINEVVTAVLLNYMILLLSNYLLLYSPLANQGLTVATSITLRPVLNNTVVVIVSVVIVVVYDLVMRRTTAGFRLRMIGYNPEFTKACGINILRTVLVAATVGGVLAGLTASGEVLGVYNKMYHNYMRDIGYSAVTAALIGRYSVVGILFGSILLGALVSGSVKLQIFTGVTTDIIQVIRGFVMLFAVVNILRLNKPGRKSEGR